MREDRPGCRPQGSWTTVAALALVVLAVLRAPSAGAGVEFSVEPTMTRGPASAPVTIVEFSDYQ